jgi:hypothetical protein
MNTTLYSDGDGVGNVAAAMLTLGANESTG